MRKFILIYAFLLSFACPGMAQNTAIRQSTAATIEAQPVVAPIPNGTTEVHQQTASDLQTLPVEQHDQTQSTTEVRQQIQAVLPKATKKDDE